MKFKTYILPIKLNSLLFYNGSEFTHLYNKILTVIHITDNEICVSYQDSDKTKNITIKDYDINEFQHVTAEDILSLEEDNENTISVVDNIYKDIIYEYKQNPKNIVSSLNMANTIESGFLDTAFKSLKSFIKNMEVKEIDRYPDISRRIKYRYNRIYKEMNRLLTLYNNSSTSQE